MDRHTLLQTINQVDELLRHGSPSCIHQANSTMLENFNTIAHFALRLTEPKPKSKHTITDNYPAGGLTATEPCTFCENYEALRTANAELLKERADYVAENELLKKGIIDDNSQVHILVPKLLYEELEAEVGRLRLATGLLNSMVICGESHSEVSKKVVKEALKK